VPPILSQYNERVSQSEAEIEGQPSGVAVLVQVLEGLEGLVEIGHRFAERGTVVGLGAGLLAVGHSLAPHLPQHGVVGQTFSLLGRSVPSEPLQGQPFQHVLTC
jgi:hypothetical protein